MFSDLISDAIKPSCQKVEFHSAVARFELDTFDFSKKKDMKLSTAAMAAVASAQMTATYNNALLHLDFMGKLDILSSAP